MPTTIQPKRHTRTYEKKADYFSEVWVISLERRGDRLHKFFERLRNLDWPFKQPVVFTAIDGEKVGVPRYWQTGSGSYGCLRSHASILERAIQSDADSILVIEDDAIFSQEFPSKLHEFLHSVPEDWECLMLGGQHANDDFIWVDNAIVKPKSGVGIQRTHCYALRGQAVMKHLYQTWMNSTVHCDWVMGPAMLNFNTYAPHPFLVGQVEGGSDISLGYNPTTFWRSANGLEPVVVLQSSREVMEELRHRGWHGGYTRDAHTGLDCGLTDIFDREETDPVVRRHLFLDWLFMIQDEVVALPRQGICTIWHPLADYREFKNIWKGRVISVEAESADDAEKQLPPDIHDTLGIKQILVLLRSSKDIMEGLAALNWHFGSNCDRITGFAKRLTQIFETNLSDARLRLNLEKFANRLCVAANRSKDKTIPAIWHPKVDEGMFDANIYDVFTVKATSVRQAQGAIVTFKTSLLEARSYWR